MTSPRHTWLSIGLLALASCLSPHPAAAQGLGPFEGLRIPNPQLAELTRHEFGIGAMRASAVWNSKDASTPPVGAHGTWGVGVEYGWRASRRWHLRVPIMAIPSRMVAAPSGDVPVSFTSLFVTPGVRLRTSAGKRWHVYAGGGGGIARFVESAQRLDGSTHSPPRSSTRPVGHLEFGFEYRFTSRFSAQWGLYGYWAQPTFMSDRLNVTSYPLYMPLTLVTRF